MKKIEYENRADTLTFASDMRLGPTPHLHKDVELIYVINGESHARADRKDEMIKTGDLFISFPNQIHYYEGSKTGEYLILIFSPDILFELKNILYDNVPKKNILCDMQNSEIVKLLLKAANTDGDYRRTFSAGLINQIMAMILPEIGIKPRIKTDNTTLQSILNYCQQNFAEELSLEKLAEDLRNKDVVNE